MLQPSSRRLAGYALIGVGLITAGSKLLISFTDSGSRLSSPDTLLAVLVGLSVAAFGYMNLRVIPIEQAVTRQLAARVYFPALTGLRAVAAYMVFVHHYFLPVELVGQQLYAFLREFHSGVTVFFVLSGFLIYFAYSKKVARSRKFLLPYIRNRISRIYPMYFLIVIGQEIFYILSGTQTGVVKSIVLQLTFLRGFSDAYKFIGVSQGWSLTVEECFYLAAPFLIILMRKRGMLQTLLMTYIMGLVLLLIGGLLPDVRVFETATFMATYTFWGRAAEFFMGMYLGQIISKRKTLELTPGRFAICTYTAVGGMLLVIWKTSRIQISTGLHLGLEHPLGIVINNFILASFIALLIYGLITEESILRRILSTPLPDLLGRSSYVFYLIHVGFIASLFDGIIILSLPGPLQWLARFVALNVVSIALYFFFEEPARLLLRGVKTREEKTLSEIKQTP